MKWLVLLLVACDPPPLEMKDYPCPQGSTLTYDNFGAAFLGANCTTCHAADPGNRHGAPDAYRFDTLADVHAHAARMFVSAAATNTSMPPGPYDPPLAERDMLADWLACGAP